MPIVSQITWRKNVRTSVAGRHLPGPNAQPELCADFLCVFVRHQARLNRAGPPLACRSRLVKPRAA